MMTNKAGTDVDRDPQRMQAFLDRLRQCKGPRITSDELWSLFGKTFPYRPGSSESRRWLFDALHEAEQQGIIRLPSPTGKRWDRGLSPPLPALVWKKGDLFSKRNEVWRTFPWHPQLSWVADMNVLSSEQETFLLRVQEALVQGTFQKQAPLKYRSLQLTGNEKRLGEIARTALFQPGRLSFELLGCVPEILPLALERVGARNTALIFENVGSFRIAYEVLKHFPQPPYGLLCFGAGASFGQSILNFKLLNQNIDRIEYVGDIDRPGLRIALSATRRAATDNLPPILPARNLHRAMLSAIQKFGYPGGLEYRAKEKKSDVNDITLVSWLPDDIRGDALAIIRSGKRVPEEVLGPDEMREVWINLAD